MIDLSEYRIERISKDSLRDLIPLYKIAFHKRYSIEYLEKKFDTTVFGAENIGYIAYYREQAIACFALFPCKMAYEGQLVLGAQAGDTMTHPQHSGKGLFTYLAGKTFELAKREGIKFIYGLPNKSSYHVLTKRLSWTHAENMNLYRMKIITLPFAKINHRGFIGSFVYAKYLKLLKFFYQTDQSFKPSVVENNIIHVKAGADYMNYKVYGGSFVLKLNDVKVWMRANGQLLVGDIEITGDENISQFFKKLKRFAFLAGCGKIIFSFSKGTFWDIQLSKYLATEKGFPIIYLNLGSGLPLEKLAFSFSVLDTF